jgi:hypothetical protein
MADEKNTAAVAFRETREAIQYRTSFAGMVEIDAGAKVAVQWVDDQQASMGSLQRILEGRGIAETQRRRLAGAAGDDSAQ